MSASAAALHVRELGAGPPVVLLHGSPSPSTDWLPVAERLAARFRVLIPDFPGCGQSPDVGEASIDETDQLLADELAARGAGELHAIVGFSSGAYRAFELVLRGRCRASTVIGLGAFAYFDEPARELRRQIAATLDADPGYLRGPEVADILRELMLSPGWRAAHPDDVARVLRWVDQVSPAGFAAELRALAGLADLRPELPRLQARVYLRVGELDPACPPSVSHEIAALVPRATVDVVPGCGHTLLIEDLDGTTAAIVRELGA